MEGGVIDRAVVAISYAYDATSERVVKMGLDRVSAGIAAVTAAWVGAALEASHAAHAAADAGKVLGMSAEDYTRWAYVVERTGSSLEALRTGLITLQRQMGAARTGTGPAADALRELGLASDVVSGRVSTAADLLPMLADALGRVTDEGKRAELGLLLLGEAGPKMSGLLEQGSAGLALLQQRADRLGATISDDVVAQSMDLNDALDDLGKYTVGISREIGFTLVPALGRAAGAFRDLAVETRPLVSEGIDRTIGAIGRALDSALTTAAGRAAIAGGALAVAWGARGVAGALAASLAEAVPLLGTLGSMGTTAAMGAARFGLYGAAIAGAALAAEDLYQASMGVDSVTLRLAERLGLGGPVQDSLRSVREMFGSAAAAAAGLGSALLDSVVSAVDDLADALEALGPYMADVVETLRRVRDTVAGGLSGFADTTDRAARGFDRFGRYLAGDETVAIRAGAPTVEDVTGLGLLGRLARADLPTGAEILTAYARQRRPDDALLGEDFRTAGRGVSVNVSVQSGPTRREMADAAAEAVRRQVLDATQAMP